MCVGACACVYIHICYMCMYAGGENHTMAASDLLMSATV